MTETNQKQPEKDIGIVPFSDLPALAKYLCKELRKKKFVLLYAYNGTGKTRLSTVFKDLGRKVDESGEVELHEVMRSGAIYTYHFNMLRRQTACFLGYPKWEECIQPEDDDPNQTVYKRVIDLMSHGDYSLYEPREMLPENKGHFARILRQFITRHPFSPTLFPNEAT